MRIHTPVLALWTGTAIQVVVDHAHTSPASSPTSRVRRYDVPVVSAPAPTITGSASDTAITMNTRPQGSYTMVIPRPRFIQGSSALSWPKWSRGLRAYRLRIGKKIPRVATCIVTASESAGNLSGYSYNSFRRNNIGSLGV